METERHIITKPACRQKLKRRNTKQTGLKKNDREKLVQTEERGKNTKPLKKRNFVLKNVTD